MGDFSLEELAENGGASTGNFGKNVANRGADFICGLYRDYPGTILKNPGSAFIKGLWDSLCVGRPAGLPTPPVKPFTGGQCFCAPYVIVIGLWKTPTDGPYSGGIAVRGPISGVRLNPANTAFVQVLAYPNGAPCTGPQTWIDAGTLGFPPDRFTVQSISRDDGGQDNCGDPPAVYPTTAIPNSRLTGSTTIVQNDGTNVTLPIVYAPISGSLPINVDVGGVPVKFDFSGAKLGIGDEATTDAELAQKLADLEALLLDLDAATDRLEQKELLRSELEKNSAISLEDLEAELEDSTQDKEGIDRLAYVLIELQQIPNNAKNQAGSGGEDLVYAGWFEFKKGVNCFPREPIHFKKSVFQAPLGSDGFSYTLGIGFSGMNKVIKFKPNEDEV